MQKDHARVRLLDRGREPFALNGERAGYRRRLQVEKLLAVGGDIVVRQERRDGAISHVEDV